MERLKDWLNGSTWKNPIPNVNAGKQKDSEQAS